MGSEIEKIPQPGLPYLANKDVEYLVQFKFQIYSESFLSVSIFHAMFKPQFFFKDDSLFIWNSNTFEFYLEIYQKRW